MFFFVLKCEKALDVNKCIPVNSNNGNIARQGRTALHDACEIGNEQVVKILVENGSDPNIICPNTKHTTLLFASQHDNVKIFELLVRYGFNLPMLINNVDFIHFKSVFLNLCHFGNLKCLEYLINRFGNNFDNILDTFATTVDNANGLHLAILEQHLDVVEFLLSNVYRDDKINTNDIARNKVSIINGTLNNGAGCLHCVMYKSECGNNKRIKLFQLLLKHGCKLDVRDNNQFLPFHYAIKFDRPFMVKYMIDEKFYEINSKLTGEHGVYNRQPIATHLACIYSSVECAKVLTSYSNVDILDTRCDLESLVGNTDSSIKILPNIKGTGLTPFELSCVTKNAKILRLFMEKEQKQIQIKYSIETLFLLIDRDSKCIDIILPYYNRNRHWYNNCYNCNAKSQKLHMFKNNSCNNPSFDEKEQNDAKYSQVQQMCQMIENGQIAAFENLLLHCNSELVTKFIKNCPDCLYLLFAWDNSTWVEKLLKFEIDREYKWLKMYKKHFNGLKEASLPHKCNMKAIRFLIENGAKLKPSLSKYVFLKICGNGDVECLDYFLNQRQDVIFDVYCKDKRGLNGLYYAIWNQQHKMIEYLISNVFFNHKYFKPNPNTENILNEQLDGCYFPRTTPIKWLFLLYSSNNENIAFALFKLFLQHGGRIDFTKAVDKNWQVSLQKNFHFIFEYILTHIDQVSEKDEIVEWVGMLELAIKYGRLECVALLLSHPLGKKEIRKRSSGIMKFAVNYGGLKKQSFMIMRKILAFFWAPDSGDENNRKRGDAFAASVRSLNNQESKPSISIATSYNGNCNSCSIGDSTTTVNDTVDICDLVDLPSSKASQLLRDAVQGIYMGHSTYTDHYQWLLRLICNRCKKNHDLHTYSASNVVKCSVCKNKKQLITCGNGYSCDKCRYYICYGCYILQKLDIMYFCESKTGHPFSLPGFDREEIVKTIEMNFKHILSSIKTRRYNDKILFYCCLTHKPFIIETILKRGVKRNVIFKDKCNVTPLWIVSRMLHYNSCKFGIKTVNRDGYSKQYESVYKIIIIQLMRVLLDENNYNLPKYVNEFDSIQKLSPFCHICEDDNFSALEYLMKKCNDMKCQINFEHAARRRSGLHFAIKGNSEKIVQYLLENIYFKHVQDVNSNNNKFRGDRNILYFDGASDCSALKTPLLLACSKNQLNITKMLLKYDKDHHSVLIENKKYGAPLSFAVLNCDTNIVALLADECLMNKYFSVSSISDALKATIFHNKLECIKILCDKFGIRPKSYHVICNSYDNRRVSLLQFAILYGTISMVKQLLSITLASSTITLIEMEHLIKSLYEFAKASICIGQPKTFDCIEQLSKLIQTVDFTNMNDVQAYVSNKNGFGCKDHGNEDDGLHQLTTSIGDFTCQMCGEKFINGIYHKCCNSSCIYNRKICDCCMTTSKVNLEKLIDQLIKYRTESKIFKRVKCSFNTVYLQ